MAVYHHIVLLGLGAIIGCIEFFLAMIAAHFIRFGAVEWDAEVYQWGIWP